MKRDKTTEVIRESFLDLTLSLEAIFFLYKADDDLVDAIMKNVEEIYDRATRHMNKESRGKGYPAVQRFISKLTTKNRWATTSQRARKKGYRASPMKSYFTGQGI